MKVVLIQPRSKNQTLKVPPLGLAYLAAVLKSNNIKTRVFDLNVKPLSLSTILSAEKPDVIGISSIITNAREALNIAAQTKSFLPESFVVMGGPYPSMMGNCLLASHKEVDASIMGEAEFSFLELVKRLQNQQSINSVKGLVFRENHKIKTNPFPKPHIPVDEIPFPAREELEMQLYEGNAGTIFTSRGCPQQCIFCSRPIFRRTWRGFSSDYVLNEIECLIREYGVSILSILDDNFTVDMNRAERILDGIIANRWKLNIYFWNGMRADHVTNDLLLKLKKAGCQAINFGVESTDPDVLSFIKKGVSVEQIEQAIRLSRGVGIRVNIFLMIGNPGDTAGSADRLMNFVKKTNVDGVHLSMATPIRGTMFWDWVDENGHWLECDQEELLDWPIDDVTGTYPVFETPDFTAKERIKAYTKVRSHLKDRMLLI